MTKPDLIIRADDDTITARDLANIIAASGTAYDRGGPCKILPSPAGPVVRPLSPYGVVIEAHRLARPVIVVGNGERTPSNLPDRVARLYLALGEWGLPPLNGITTAPILAANGAIRDTAGYDGETGLWCADLPPISVPDSPTESGAREALHVLRRAFRTFPFADAPRVREGSLDVANLSVPPGHDESAFLAILLTAVCRPSLPLAPGAIVRAAHLSGAAAGKGLLIRAISAIAFGLEPRPFTAGGNREELEKRLAAELMDASPILFLDNVNSTALKSDLFASILTERHPRVRLLGKSAMMPLDSTAFVAVTGNGMTLSEDLARRFVICELDPRCEDPESRPFLPGFVRSIAERRDELLGAALTIWRWGRQNEPDIAPGRPLGSYEDWCRWVRDPLVALGCTDPVQRIRGIKAEDPARRLVAEIFEAWWATHGDRPVKAAELHPDVVGLIDPQGRSRQHVVAALGQLVGTRAAGFVLTRSHAVGRWSVTTYALRRDDVSTAKKSAAPTPPMIPMPSPPAGPPPTNGRLSEN